VYKHHNVEVLERAAGICVQVLWMRTYDDSLEVFDKDELQEIHDKAMW